MFRQGDVLLVPVTRLPEQARRLPRDARGRLVLALGEVTGHAHAVAAPDAELLDDPGPVGGRFLRVVTAARLTHEEHAAIPLPPGLYRVVRQREYASDRDGSAWSRQVAD